MSALVVAMLHPFPCCGWRDEFWPCLAYWHLSCIGLWHENLRSMVVTVLVITLHNPHVLLVATDCLKNFACERLARHLKTDHRQGALSYQMVCSEILIRIRSRIAPLRCPFHGKQQTRTSCNELKKPRGTKHHHSSVCALVEQPCPC